MDYPYIDIHNHDIIPKENNIVSICSFFVQKFELEYNQYDSYFTIGLHPWHVDDVNLPEILSKLEEVARLPNCIGIGEIGLDKVTSSSFNNQIIAFEQQLLLAKKLDMPVVIHNVRSLAEILHSIKKTKFENSVIFHGFTGKTQMASQIINTSNSFYLSFGKSLINSSILQDTLSLFPVSKLFFETDEGPYPIEEIYNKAAHILHSSVSDCKKIVYNNFINVFKKYNAKLA